MLTQRNIKIELYQTEIIRSVTKGVPQGGILSPLLWNIVIDTLLELFTMDPTFAQAFADDIVLMINGSDAESLLGLMNRALRKIKEWGEKHKLNFSSTKTTAIHFTRKRTSPTTKLMLGDNELKMQDSVKYLGIILDRKLSWNKHIDSIYNKAMISMGRCRRAIGKTWGLSPKAMKWMYTAIIRPTITYGCLNWTPALNKKHVVNKLEKIQRMAMLAISSSRNSVSTVALQTILNMDPIKIHLEKTALQAYYRIINQPENAPILNYKISSTQPENYHIGYLEKYAKQIPSFYMPSDRDLPTSFNGNNVKISDEEWTNESKASPGEILCFTDGSRLNGSSGAGVFMKLPDKSQRKIKVPLGKHATVFQAEITAINITVNKLIEKGIIDTNIRIICDSKAAIAAIKKNTTNSKSVKQCKLNISTLSRNNSVTINWVRSHIGIDGNEIADQVAKEATATVINGPEPIIPVPECQIKEEIELLFDKLKEETWLTNTGNKQTKVFIPSIKDGKKVEKLLLQQTRREIEK